MIHFAVAMTALRLLVELPVWQFYGEIVGIYLLFQVIFIFVVNYVIINKLIAMQIQQNNQSVLTKPIALFE